VTFDIAGNKMEVHHRHAEPWRVTLIDTGEASMTGGRLKRVMPHLENEEVFAFTYGDGLADIDLDAQLAFHRAHGKQATVTAVRPLSRFGALTMEGDVVRGFREKPDEEGGLINGGFFLLSPKVGERIAGDATIWEHEPMESLARDNELRAFNHPGFWQPMDTLRDKNVLEDRWANGRAEWKTW
jgi:glucose-1-phosphate cytidylyltransferase